MGLFNKLFNNKQNDEKQTTEALALEEKQDMIKGIEDLSETSVKEVMIPRIDVDFLPLGTPQEELLEKIYNVDWEKVTGEIIGARFDFSV